MLSHAIFVTELLESMHAMMLLLLLILSTICYYTASFEKKWKKSTLVASSEFW